MGEFWMYDTAPRGVTSNNGFEREDAERAETLARNSRHTEFRSLLRQAEALASDLWKQEKYRGVCNERDFVDRFKADIAMVAREYAIDGALPEDSSS